MSAKGAHVFVSHSSDNRELANELAAFLERRGIRIWIAPRDVRPGMDYSEELQRAIEECAAFVVLVTDMANKSPYVRAETEMAFSTHKPIFPVRTSNIQPAPGLAFFLKIRHWTDAFGNLRADNLDRLVRELQTAAGVTAPAAATPPPIQGAAAFTAAPAPPPPPPGPAQGGQAAGSAEPPVPPEGEDEEAWRAAIGPNADFYMRRWRAMEAKKTAINWNWPAALVSAFWFAYRKMWVPMAAVIGASFLLGLVAGAAGSAQLNLLFTIAISFVTGGFGNHLYRRQTQKLIARTGALPRGAQVEALRARGGTSAVAVGILLGIVLLLTLIALIGAAQQAQIGNDGGTLDTSTSDNRGGGGFDDGQSGDFTGEKPPVDESELPPEEYPADY
ncbi:TIR domain-containing protein [Sphingosinicella terrae]|uniref:TIR domain-containing protein n=1 Tax=Sphingosinicella terrae TaxID=2172047 RepID=UPI000E0DFF3F|nr:TIR domain-containing protein [Sphingosinicella terrae]